MKKIETKKILAVILIICGIIWVSTSYILAAFDIYTTNESISTEVVRSIIGVYLGYCLTSFAEKNSRNKYSIDEYGCKIKDGDKGDN